MELIKETKANIEKAEEMESAIENLTELVKKQEITQSFHVVNFMSRAAIYEQLAEEASELAAAALKTARALREENPTAISAGRAAERVEEKYSGLTLVAKELNLFPSPMAMADKKLRMVERMRKSFEVKDPYIAVVKNRAIRDGIRRSRTFEDVDMLLNNTWCRSDADKMDYLKQLFEGDVVFDELRDTTYPDTVNAILNRYRL